jgi:GT2 family glycosyltransferase
MTFSFVIPTYNHYDLLHQVLFGIYNKCAPVDEIIVVDDCSTDKDYYDGLSWWKENGMLPIRHLHMNSNKGFILSSNAGLKRAKSDIICLLSNDVKVGSDIVTSISAMLNVDKKCLVGNRLIDWDSGWNRFGNTVYPYIEGWLLAATNKGWKELGYLDEDLVPNDFEDVALSTNAINLDYALVSLDDDRVVHMGGQSIGFNPAREEVTKRNQEKFRKKYANK